MTTTKRNTKADLLARVAECEAELSRLRAADTSRVTAPSGVARRIRELCGSEQESFVVLVLDARQRVLKATEVARGSLSQVDVHPREVFRDAVRMCAHSILVGHNHPSGDTDPSDADCTLTQRLSECGRILGIPVLDHVIVTGDDYCSFAADTTLAKYLS